MSSTEQEVALAEPQQREEKFTPIQTDEQCDEAAPISTITLDPEKIADPEESTPVAAVVEDVPASQIGAPAVQDNQVESTSEPTVEVFQVEETPSPAVILQAPQEVQAEQVVVPVVVEETSAVSPAVVEETSAVSPAVVEETSAVSPVVIEETSAVSPIIEEPKVEKKVETLVAAPIIAVEEKKIAPAPAPVTTPTANKWSSDFTTRAPAPISLTSTTTSSSTSNIAAAKTVIPTSNISATKTVIPSSTPAVNPTITPSPIVSRTPSAVSVTPATTPSGSSIHSRAAAWNNNQPLQAPKTTDFSRPTGSVTPSSSAQLRPTTFSYSNSGTLNATQTQINAYDSRSLGTHQGSLASLMGGSLQTKGVQHKGQFTGLVKARVDPEEERARQELIRNKHTNSSLQSAMRQSICVADDIRSGKRQSAIPSEQFLAKKLDTSASQTLFAKAKSQQNTNTDGSVVVGAWIEPTSQ